MSGLFSAEINKQIYEYHKFLWLSMINRKIDEKNIQQIIYFNSKRLGDFLSENWHCFNKCFK